VAGGRGGTREAGSEPPLLQPLPRPRWGRPRGRHAGGRQPLGAGRAAGHTQPPASDTGTAPQPPSCRRERAKVGAAEQPSASTYVAAEASVPNQIIIKPNQNNANMQYRLVLKKRCSFLPVPLVKAVTRGRAAQGEGPSQGQLRGKKGWLCLCRQQESTWATGTALRIHPRDTVLFIPLPHTLLPLVKHLKALKKLQKASSILKTC